jgi:hypothetical protein
MASPVEKFLGYQIAGLFLFALITSLKDGSWINYYNEFIIVTIISAVYYFSKMFTIHRENPGSTDLLKVFYIYVFVLIPSIFLYDLFHVHYQDLKKNASDYNEKLLMAGDLHRLFATSANTFFISFETEINSMLPERAVLPNKEIVVSCSKFNYERYRDYVKSGRIRYMILPNAGTLNSFMDADLSFFHPIQRHGKWVILENDQSFSENKN